MRIFTTIILILLCTAVTWGQRSNTRNEGPVMMINFSYAFQIPAGDLVDRFGNNFNLGGGLDFMTRKNFIIGFQGNYLFGNEVKTNLVQDLDRQLSTGELAVYSNAFIGEPADFQFKERGFYFGGHIGKLFTIGQTNKRSGIRVTVGGGYLQHKIRVQDDPEGPVPVLAQDYKQGWDKLTSGFALTEFVGYQFMSRNRRLNFSFGLEFTQGFTQNRRDYDFQTRTESNKDTRKDNLIGFRINWALPLYFEGEAEEVFY